MIDQTLGGYTIRRMLARGGMGVVYEGVQEALRRRVAIKVMYPHLGDDETFRERFQREAHAIAQLRHPNIVGIIDFGTDRGFYFMVMDLIDGPSLRDELARRQQQGQPFSSADSLTILGHIATALSYAHRRGMIHRDVKPANVMLDSHGDVFLTDFGLVKLADTHSVTMTGMIVGTPEYMAPEQSIGVSDVTTAVDQYSLAVIAYQLFVGRVPFTAPTPMSVMQKHISEPPPPPSTIVPTFPASIERVLMRGLSKNPDDRYATIDVFLNELRHVVGGDSPSTATVPQQTSGRDQPRAVETTVVDFGDSAVMERRETTTFDAVAATPPEAPNTLFAPPASGPTSTATDTPQAQIGHSTAAHVSDARNPAPFSFTTATAAPATSDSGAGHPPSSGWPLERESSGSRRSPMLAVAIALTLVLLAGGVAAGAFVLTGGDLGMGGDDATSTPHVVIRTPTAEATALVAVLDPTSTAVEIMPVSTEIPVAAATVAPVYTPTVAAVATARLIPTATPSPVVVVVPETATPVSAAVADEWTLLVDERFDASTLFHIGEINGGATTGLVDSWYGISVPEGRWQTVNATWIEPLDSAFAATHVGYYGAGKAGLAALFRTESDGTYSFYACWLSSNGAAGCDEVVSNFWTPVFRLPEGSVQVLDGNDLSLYVANSELTFRINSEEVVFRLPVTSSYGHWGLFAQNESGELTVWFYYLQVYAPNTLTQ